MIYLELFYVFFKIGLLTFGGGYAMIPMIKAEVVARNWISADLLVDFLAISESTPGSFAVNISTFVGTNTAGILGAICATLGVIFPSFIIILIIFQFYKRFITNNYVKGILIGLRAVVVGLILAVALDLVFNQFITLEPNFNFNYIAFIIFIVLIMIKVLYFYITKKKINTIFFIMLSAILGILVYGVIL